MAGFGDANDIKINVTLDTEAAIKSAQELKTAIESSLKVTEEQFNKVKQVANQLSSTLAALSKAEVSTNKDKLNKIISDASQAAKVEVGIAEDVANKKTKAAQKAAAAALEAEKVRVREMEVLARQEADREKTRRTELLKDIAQLNKDRAVIRKTPRSELPSDLGGVSGAGKLVDAFKNSLAGLSLQFGNVNVGFGTFISNFKNLGAVGGTIAGLTATIGAIVKLDRAINDLATQATKVEGLTTGFKTLQRTIGQDPTKSIEALRAATRGLISDVDLYQRANQAVLLGVPTKVFNEAAGAAVKLGRAMGIDAAFGLESLSLGLGRQSRLYLDNLGIIVSAEEAYRNFALSVGKSAQDLTDAEKKAAFFAEALKKIKERAEELPEPLDTVGTSLEKLQIAQENANKKFNEGFNASQPLIEAYKQQSKVAEASILINEKLGLAVGVFSAIAKKAATVIDVEFLKAKAAFVQFVDIFADLRTSEERIKSFEASLAIVERRIQKLAEVRDKLKSQGFTLGNPRFADAERALATAQEQAKALRAEIVLLRGEGDKGIKINVDNSEVIAAQSQISSLFRDLGKEAEREAGIFKVPGIADPQSAKIFSEFKTAKENFDKSLKDTAAVDRYKESLKKLEQDVSTAAVKSSFANLAKDVTVFAGAITSGQIGKAKDALEGIKGGFTQISSGAVITRVSLKDLEAGLNGVLSQLKKSTAESKKFSSQLDKEQRELEQFNKSIAKSLGTAIPPELQKRLVDLFNDGSLSAQQLESQIRQIGEEAKKAGIDLDPLQREIQDLAELAKQGITIKVNAQQTKAAAKDIDDYNSKLEQAQSGVVNLRDLIFGPQTEGGKKAGGGFFGFDTSEMFGPETQAGLQSAVGAETFAGVEAAIAKAIVDGLKLAITLAFEKFTREDAPQIGEQIGTTLGGDIGGIVGRLTGEYIVRNTQDLASTKVRKNIDRYFSDLFDGERLSIVIQGQLTGAIDQATGEAIRSSQPQIARLSDLVFEGFTPFAGNVSFGGENFRSYFDTLSSDIQASFNGVGLALGTLQGVSAEQARLIGIAISNNIGGSLQNLQVLIQQTGESFEDLSNAITESFLNSQLTIEEAYNALLQIQNIFEDGIPGAIGAWEEAIDNFAAKIQDNLPGRYLVDSFRDIGAEAKEANASFQQVVTAWAEKAGLAGQQVQLFFLALRNAGITNLDQLATAGNNVVISVLEAFRQIREGAATTAEDVNKIPIIPDIKPASTPRGGGRNPEVDNAKKLREEIQKLLRESTAYEEIVRKITSGELARAAAGAQIIKLQREIESALRRRNDLEKRYSEELAKGSKANKKTLADLAADLDKVNEKIKKFTEEATKSTRQFKAINLEGVIPLIKSANMLGVVATQVGVSLEKASDVLIKGFLQGRLTLKELREEMERTEETLGPGIPNAVGAVTEAFQGLIDAGTQGGQFSVDAFRDIFAEFREKFQKEGSALREAERKQLEENLKAARSAFAQAVGPEATAAAKKTLDEAKKALEDFYAAAPAPDLADLRAQLNSVFGETEVNKFFQALGESGLSTFEDFEKAGTDSIVGILQKLQEIGFNFGDTSQAIIDANKELVEAEKVANAGLDPLQEAINLIKGLNEGAAQLPPVFNSTTTAIEGLNGPLASLSAGFDDILEKLAILSQKQSFEKDIVFNVSTVGESGAQALVDIIFGDGSGTTTTVGGTTSGGNASDSNTSQIARLRKEIQRLQKKKSTRSIKERIASLRKKIVELGG